MSMFYDFLSALGLRYQPKSKQAQEQEQTRLGQRVVHVVL